MKGIIRKLIVLTLAFSALMAFSAFAAGWTLDGAVQTMAVRQGMPEPEQFQQKVKR